MQPTSVSTIRMDPDAVDAIAAKIKNERDGTVAELVARLHGLNAELDGAWDGGAQLKFAAEYGDWIKDLEKFADKLAEINLYLKGVAAHFRELDEAAKKAILLSGRAYAN